MIGLAIVLERILLLAFWASGLFALIIRLMFEWRAPSEKRKTIISRVMWTLLLWLLLTIPMFFVLFNIGNMESFVLDSWPF